MEHNNFEQLKTSEILWSLVRLIWYIVSKGLLAYVSMKIIPTRTFSSQNFRCFVGITLRSGPFSFTKKSPKKEIFFMWNVQRAIKISAAKQYFSYPKGESKGYLKSGAFSQQKGLNIGLVFKFTVFTQKMWLKGAPLKKKSVQKNILGIQITSNSKF